MTPAAWQALRRDLQTWIDMEAQSNEFLVGRKNMVWLRSRAKFAIITLKRMDELEKGATLEVQP